MLFFSRTTRWVLAPLADRLEQPDQASTPLSSNHPLLRRILAGVEQLLQERHALKEQTRALTLHVSQLDERLADRDQHLRQLEARWALITRGADELFWSLDLEGAAAPTVESRMDWTGSASIEAQGIDQLGRWSEQLHPADRQPHLEALAGILPTAAGGRPLRSMCG